MLLNAIIVFSIAAAGGLVMALKILRGGVAPWPLSILHALLGALGLVLLIFAAASSAWPGQVTAALAILVVAALGGFYLASLHLRGRVTPKGILVIHAGAAVVGLLTLVTVYLGLV